MEEIREVALAYYYNFSDDEKRVANQVFRGFDSNGDGTITFDEYLVLMDSSNGIIASWARRIFQELDTNGDGKLDFEEFITLFYLLKARFPVCDGTGCKATVMKFYFTCVDCFNHSNTETFFLCVSCYRYRNYVHTHNTFLDRHLLVQYYRANYQPISRDEPSQVDKSKSKRNMALVIGLDVGASIGQAVGETVINTVASGCSIM